MEVSKVRREEIDWLRIIAVLLLFPFHTAMIFFSKENFYFKISPSHPILDYLILFLSPWHMPFLFFLAGISSYYALKRRTTREYIVERTKRLLTPLIFGIIFIVPPQSYIAYISKHPNSSFADFTSFYFSNLFSDLTGYTGTFTPAHLWFILYLYFYSILSVRLLNYLLNNEKHIQTTFKSASVYLILITYPIIIGLLDQLPSISTKNPFYYYPYFLIGFLTPLCSSMETTINKHQKLLLCFGIITMAIHLYLTNSSFEKYSLGDILYYILRRYNAWLWVLLIFSTGIYFKNYTNKLLNYLTEASYPIYICHQTIIVISAYLLYKIFPAIPLLFFTICLLLSTLLTFLIYHILIRKIALFRVLFGMKTKTSTNGEVQ